MMMGMAAVCGVAAHRAADLEAIQAGQHDVEQQQVGWRLAHAGKDIPARGDHVGLEAGALQVMREQARDVGIVLRDKDPAHGGSIADARVRTAAAMAPTECPLNSAALSLFV